MHYRPISLLSNIEKIYEKIMHSRVISFLNRFNQIYSRQFGFRKAHSTEHILTKIVERIRESLDNKVSLPVVCLLTFRRPLILWTMKFFWQNLITMVFVAQLTTGLNHTSQIVPNMSLLQVQNPS